LVNYLKELLDPERKDDNPIKGYDRFVRLIGKWGVIDILEADLGDFLSNRHFGG
jgi:hypothetical protein